MYFLAHPRTRQQLIAPGPRRAFIQFDHIDRAIDFVQEHYPKILINLRHSTDEVPDGQFDAYLHYARSRDDAESRVPNAEWICPQVCCERNQSNKDPPNQSSARPPTLPLEAFVGAAGAIPLVYIGSKASLAPRMPQTFHLKFLLYFPFHHLLMRRCFPEK